MFDLKNLQKQFMQGLQSAATLDFIDTEGPITALQKINIYKNNILITKQNALRRIYPVCEQLVGTDFFNQLAEGYIERYRSRSFNLIHYGKYFSRWARSYRPAQSLPYLSDVIRLEWAWHQNAFATHFKPVSGQELADQSEKLGEKMVFALPPAACLLSTHYPAHQILQAVRPQAQEGLIVLPALKKHYYLIRQNNLTVEILLLSIEEWYLFKWIRAGLNLGEICEKWSSVFTSKDLHAALLMALQQQILVSPRFKD